MSDSESPARSVDGADEEERKTIEDVRNPDVVTKYKAASEIANKALALVLKGCVAGAKVVDLCEAGDALITAETAKVYNKGKVTKGIGFPTSVAVNNVVGSFSPMGDDDTVLKDGDMVKVDLGAHVDGYIAQAAHTVVVGAERVEGKQADVLAAVYTAADAVIRMMRPGVRNSEITEVVTAVARDFGVSCVEGVHSFEVNRFEIEGEKRIDNFVPETPLTGEQKTKDCKLEANEVWGFDVCMSSGSGRPQAFDERTTIYRRVVDKSYSLKMKASRALLSEVQKKFPVFPFTLRAIELPGSSLNMGSKECHQHELLDAYPVLREKEGDHVAHIKFTVMLLPNGTTKITGMPLDHVAAGVRTEIKPKSEIVVKALSTGIFGKKKKKKGNKKKKPKAADAAAE